MKYTLSLILSLFLSVNIQAQIEKKALFIGNSYTYFNQLPELVEGIANAKGNIFNHQSHTPGGTSLSTHANNATVQNLFSASQWDYVILQAQSQEPSFHPSQVANQVYPYANSLCENIRAANACTKPVFYMTWGRENGDANNCAIYPPICTYEGMQERLETSYTEMADNNSALLAPVGTAWKTIRSNFPSINLYHSDGSHPSIQGSYLAACVFYAVLYNDSPASNFMPEDDDFTQEEAQILQTVAYNTVQEVNVNYTTIAQATASYEIIGDSLHLFNESTNYSSISWTGISQNIVSDLDTLSIYIGDYSGSYEIDLSATDNCNESVFNITLNNLSIQNLENSKLLFPNPSSGLLNFQPSNLEEASVSIFNTLGVCVYKNERMISKTLDLSYFSDGIYLVEISSKNGIKKQLKWLKKN